MTHFDGHNGQVDFDGTSLRIAREGKLGQMNGNGPTTLGIGDIVDVIIHEPGSIVKGYMYFATAAAPEVPEFMKLSKDPATVLVAKKQLAAAQALRDEVLKAIGKG
jgi:hypothetical protein